jgi:hypothetical protein
MTRLTPLIGAALLAMLAACNSGPPSEDTLRARAQRECNDRLLPPGSAALKYCIDDEMRKYRRSGEVKRLYDSTIRNIPTSPSP